jgi:hypothetical protein
VPSFLYEKLKNIKKKFRFLNDKNFFKNFFGENLEETINYLI